ncbi:DUF5999 family protein [Streptomyces zhihengii]|uniref:Uncharacterized protein n=1 Tax=Streptomyces zhihengii TaxID=1818004 RepID=A0ABS2V7A6_9ACTN|nr:DUF5999 family protein [Streptomyces zhihengii]MBM9624645.1 hypothetical protein [Streptomyces zhihengii]
MCEHSPKCPSATAADRLAASVYTASPEAGWSLLCNGVVTFEDTGYLLPSGDICVPQRPLPREAAVT